MTDDNSNSFDSDAYDIHLAHVWVQQQDHSFHHALGQNHDYTMAGLQTYEDSLS